MRNILVALLGLVSVIGCHRKIPSEVAPPPLYLEGVPQDLYYENMAMRTEEMAPPGEIPSNPHEAYLLALQEIQDQGVELVPKATGFEKWDRFNTTFPGRIFISKNWDEKDEATRAAILWHEMVHLREYETHTPLIMGTIYLAVAEARWALEVQAYRESFRVWRTFGMPQEDLRERMIPRAESLYFDYELRAMPQEYAIRKAVEIWMLDSK